MKFNLREWKKLHSEKDHTLFKNSEGHELKIYHKNLSPKMRAEIIALPENKKADSKDSFDARNKNIPEAKETKNDYKKDDLKAKDKEQSMAKGGMVKSKKYDDSTGTYAKGGTVPTPAPTPQPAPSGDSGSSDDANKKPVGKIINYPGFADGGDIEKSVGQIIKYPGFDEGGEAPEAEDAAPDSAPDEDLPVSAQIPDMQMPAALAPEGAAPAPAPAGAMPDAAPSIAPQAPAAQPAAPTDPISMLQQGYQQQQAGIQQEAATQGAIGKREADVLQKGIEQKQQTLDVFQKHYNDLDAERKAAVEDLKNFHIDPWKGIDKTRATIGLILAGFSPSNRPNAAMEFLNKQMENNIQAQTQELGARHNILSGALQQFGNLKDATDFTRVIQADSVADQLKQAAAQQTDPLAKARALQAAGQLQQQYAPLYQQFAIKQSLINTAKQGGDMSALLPTLRVMNPEMAKEVESRYVPGVGMAQVPVPNEMRDRLVKQSTLINATQNLRDWVKDHGASVDPSVRAQGETLAAELQQMYRQGVGASTSGDEQKTINDKIISASPAQIIARWNVDPKLKALQESMVASHNVTRKLNGLPQLPEPGRNAYLAWAKQNVNSKDPNKAAKARLTLKKYGE